ncbi:MAG TPA: ATP-binding protein, partial [Candidatus Ozemobacteraceae bacterium]|nr:ATP-binding protein [Candidatus Ozemobacteraceae bacterium]
GRLLRGLALNLLTNAVQAGAGKIEILCGFDSTHLRLELIDDGPGIPDSVRRNLFMPGNTTRADGSGLGLYNAWRTAAALGGQLELAETGPGKTRFVISIPIDTEGEGRT